MSKPNGGPAFPTESKEWAARSKEIHEGMTLRDYFAGQALAGSCADKTFWANTNDRAELCYLIADAMIAAREANQ